MILKASLPSIYSMSYLSVVGLLAIVVCFSISIPTVNSKVVTSIENDLEFDENDKLATHSLVFPANRPDCPTADWEGSTELGGRIMGFSLSGDALARVFPNYHYQTDSESDTRCVAAYLEKGTDKKLVGYTMPPFKYEGPGGTPENKSQFKKWFENSCHRVEVCFVNYVTSERPLMVYWIDPKGKASIQSELHYGQRKTNCFNSYLGHRFEAIDEESGFFEQVTIEHTTSKGFGTSPPSSTQKF